MVAMKRDGFKFEHGMNARTKTVPSLQEELGKVCEQICKFRDHVGRKCLRAGIHYFSIPNIAWNASSTVKAYDGWRAAHPGAIPVESVRDRRKTRKPMHPPCVPIDKYSQEGMLI